MLNKLRAQIRKFQMVTPGDTVICAVSGGADSMALLWGMYLLREKLGIALEAVHFNHGLRGEESLRDEKFVKTFCQDYQIPCHIGRAEVKAGHKGLEAAAREARYSYFATLPGKIATAHTANDNAETVLLHLVRGTGLKGLGGISPVRGSVIRPMLTATRQEVNAFLQEYHIPWVEDSTNETDAFLRNRLRHRVMPVLEQENPRLAENLSQMAMQLRQDELLLENRRNLPGISELRQMHPGERSRALGGYLHFAGVKEPERTHIMLLENLVFSENPSAKANFPNGVCICRNYDTLEIYQPPKNIPEREIICPGVTEIPERNLRITCAPAKTVLKEKDCFTVSPKGKMVVRSRQAGDMIRLCGGTKSLKKWMIDKKIPAHRREEIPVLADEAGVLAVLGMGVNLDRMDPEIEVRVEQIENEKG